MQISHIWLSQFVDCGRLDVAAALTGRGLEVEDAIVQPRCEECVVAEVKQLTAHSNAKLQVATIDDGLRQHTVVCGAKNIRVGQKIVYAREGGRIGERTVARRAFQDVESVGMICSAQELGLEQHSDGILVLPDSCTVGESIESLAALLGVGDTLYVVGVTPNRGDCLSHLGIARELFAYRINENVDEEDSQREISATVSLFDDARLSDYWQRFNARTIEGRFEVDIAEDCRADCPHYGCILIEEVDGAVASPLWLRLFLERCGLRSINPIVDVTNYMMLAVGKPLHAFDRDRIGSKILVRRASSGEPIELLNQMKITCDPDVLLITDGDRPIALAGIMGSDDSAVHQATKRVLLESAFFSPQTVRGRSRRYQLESGAAFRFERGVDYGITEQALAIAAEMIVDICGGRIVATGAKQYPLPTPKKIELPVSRLTQHIGIDFSAHAASRLLSALGIATTVSDDTLVASAPSYRFDIEIPEDLIEEVIRAYGYERLPATVPQFAGQFTQPNPITAQSDRLRRALSAAGWCEVINYSFTDVSVEETIHTMPMVRLSNPIAETFSVMKTTLIGDLLRCVYYNSSHRHEMIRVYEIARCFGLDEDSSPASIRQPRMIAGVASGLAVPRQWGQTARDVDYYDVAGDIERLFPLQRVDFVISPDKEIPSAFHPGKTARILLNDAPVGFVGDVHPQLAIDSDIRAATVIFEMNFDHLVAHAERRAIAPVSKFPMITRDLSILIPANMAVGELLTHVAGAAASHAGIVDYGIFDIFADAGESDKKSVGIRFVLQGSERNLRDSEIAETLQNIENILQLAGFHKRG